MSLQPRTAPQNSLLLLMPDNPDLERGGTSREGGTVGKRFCLLYPPDENNIHNVSWTSGRTCQPEAEATFTDGLGAMFSIYLKTAGEEDKKMTDSWKGDANGILVFVRTREDVLLLWHLTCFP
jgi:hypothetical protein